MHGCVCARVLNGHSCGHCFAVADFEVDKTCKTETKFSRIILMTVDRPVTVPLIGSKLHENSALILPSEHELFPC